jgi:hypothetical protein
MDITDGATLRLKSKTVTYDVVSVTPEVAQKWLGTQVRNRRVQVIAMEGYRADMIAGRWGFAGDPLRFDDLGRLIDGQNRLTALAGIEIAGFAIPFLVIRGLSADTQTVMDQGARRTAGQQFGLRGFASGSSVAAGARMALRWERGQLFCGKGDPAALITNTELLNWALANTELTELAAARMQIVRRVGLRPSAGLGFVIRMGLTYADETEALFKEMHDLSNLEMGSPTLALAKRLIRVRQDYDLGLTDLDQLGFLTQTWNRWVSGQKATRLQRPKGGWAADNFPVPQGL